VAKAKISRKELLKEPDEFITTSGKVMEFARANPRTVILASILVVVAIAAAIGLYSYLQYQRDTSHQLFLEAYANYKIQTSKSEDIPKDKLQIVFEEFDSVATNYGSYLGGELALLYSGHVLYRMKDLKGALERYQKMKSTKLAEEGLENLVMYHVAMTYLAMKEYESARPLFEQLAVNTDSPYSREAHASIAAIYEALGKKKEAIQAYRQYLKMFPKAPDAAYVKSRIADLSSDR
jgi:predicted negative regulator of RcsB-dependent stress response